ncbi:MAG: hypothetical protein CVU06_12220 [Bacteroidetes bacterium HGW-Bacteroidetes-22]|nr:MAG: hypothetical protein CVU06_12220 [Bacteroidetes bacterium HGW-Bacteroidetes-22]
MNCASEPSRQASIAVQRYSDFSFLQIFQNDFQKKQAFTRHQRANDLNFSMRFFEIMTYPSLDIAFPMVSFKFALH